MGTLAAAGTSNSKTATEPPEASPSSRNRIANCPILISSLGLVAMRIPPVLGFTYPNAAELPMRPTTGLLPPLWSRSRTYTPVPLPYKAGVAHGYARGWISDNALSRTYSPPERGGESVWGRHPQRLVFGNSEAWK